MAVINPCIPMGLRMNGLLLTLDLQPKLGIKMFFFQLKQPLHAILQLICEAKIIPFTLKHVIAQLPTQISFEG